MLRQRFQHVPVAQSEYIYIYIYIYMYFLIRICQQQMLMHNVLIFSYLPLNIGHLLVSMYFFNALAFVNNTMLEFRKLKKKSWIFGNFRMDPISLTWAELIGSRWHHKHFLRWCKPFSLIFLYLYIYINLNNSDTTWTFFAG